MQMHWLGFSFLLVGGYLISECFVFGQQTETPPYVYLCPVSQNCTCHTGYKRSRHHCLDIDECKSENMCPPDTYCKNEPSTYNCLNISTCSPGYEFNGDLCIDINECMTRCKGQNEVCDNTIGSFNCECKFGFVPDQNGCADIDECQQEIDTCTDICVNKPGAYECDCPPTKVLHWEYKNQCVDKDECHYYHTCDLPQHGGRCVNVDVIIHPKHPRGYDCICIKGFEKQIDQPDKCQDIDECQAAHGCQHMCVNLFGSFRCDCNTGYKLNTNMKNCTDIDECVEFPWVCSQLCTNNVGSYECYCDKGFELGNDNVSCSNINECERTPNICPANSVCEDFTGYYDCKCNEGFFESQDVCERRNCPYLVDPSNGNVSDSCIRPSEQPLFEQNCQYQCNTGYMLNGLENLNDQRVCQSNGEWSGQQPHCEAVKCAVLNLIANMLVHPLNCASSTTGVSFNTMCQLYCKSPFSLIGPNTITCNQLTSDGSSALWSNALTAKCEESLVIPDVDCPLGVLTVTLDPGAATYQLEVPEPVSTNVENVTTSPSQFQIGQMADFEPGLTTIVYTAHSGSQKATCEYYIRVRDEEMPTYDQCPQNVEMYATEEYPEITWQAPVFTDNSNSVSVTQSTYPEGRFTYGAYDITYRAEDVSGNQVSCKFTIEIKRQECGEPSYNMETTGMDCSAVVTTKLCHASCNSGREFLEDETTILFICDSSVTWKANIGGSKVELNVVPPCLSTAEAEGDTCPHNTLKKGDKCFYCSTGTFLNGAECSPCPIDTYADKEGSTVCTPCPRGHTEGTGSTSESQCIEGPCPAGHFGLLSGLEPCNPCPQGQYQPLTSQSSCMQCPFGSTTKSLGSEEKSQCFDPASVSGPEVKDVTLNVGGEFNQICYGVGYPQPNVTWTEKASNDAISKTIIENGNEKAIDLTIDAVDAQHSGQYVCRVENAHGSGTRTINLTVQDVVA